MVKKYATPSKLLVGLLGLVVLIVVLSLLFDSNNKKDPSLTGALDKQTNETNGVPKPNDAQEDQAPDNNFTDEDIDYFKEVSLGAKYDQKDTLIHKWTDGTINVSIKPEGTTKDRQCIADTINDFNALSARTKLRLSSVGDLEGMILIGFAPRSEFANLLSRDDMPDDLSFVQVFYGENGKNLSYAHGLVDNKTLTQDERCKHARSTLSKGMGFLSGSSKTPSSVFFNRGTSQQQDAYSEIDKRVIKIMYGDYGIVSGDSAQSIDKKLK